MFVLSFFHVLFLSALNIVGKKTEKDPETDADGKNEELEQDPVLPGRTRHTVTPALHGCTLEVKKGELVAIVGAVGSGKSR